ncbi:hypothetical protein [Blastococcus sp. SYSU D01042]
MSRVVIPGNNPPSGRGHRHEVPGYPKRELYRHGGEVVQCTCGDLFQLVWVASATQRGKAWEWRPVSRWKRSLRRQALDRIAAEQQAQRDAWARWSSNG